MTPEQRLVQQFGDRKRDVLALRDLVGGVTTTYLRTARLSDSGLAAVVEGLGDANPRIRWWCIQVLDHVPDPKVLLAIAPLLDDPVPRVRRNAAHAMGCIGCKPEWDGTLPDDVLAKLAQLATTDANAKVRDEAQRALACRA